MIGVTCPNCGYRGAEEFQSGGPPRARPDPQLATPQEWRAYLYLRPNPAGWMHDVWYHAAGCRRYLIVERNTVTGEIRSVREAGKPAPLQESLQEPTP